MDTGKPLNESIRGKHRNVIPNPRLVILSEAKNLDVSLRTGSVGNLTRRAFLNEVKNLLIPRALANAQDDCFAVRFFGLSPQKDNCKNLCPIFFPLCPLR